jgi:hypothetical protein
VALHDGVVKKYIPAPDSACASRLYKQIFHEKRLLRCKLHNRLQKRRVAEAETAVLLDAKMCLMFRFRLVETKVCRV